MFAHGGDLSSGSTDIWETRMSNYRRDGRRICFKTLTMLRDSLRSPANREIRSISLPRKYLVAQLFKFFPFRRRIERRRSIFSGYIMSNHSSAKRHSTSLTTSSSLCCRAKFISQVARSKSRSLHDNHYNQKTYECRLVLCVRVFHMQILLYRRRKMAKIASRSTTVVTKFFK